MWILLKEGDADRAGDEFFSSGKWNVISEGCPDSYGFIAHNSFPTRRNVTGWGAVKYAVSHMGKRPGLTNGWRRLRR